VKRRSLFGSAIALIASLLIAGSALAVNGFTNGSFETGPAGTTTLAGGSTAITGWTVTGTNIDYVAVTDLWEAADGSKSLDLNGFGQGGIQQSFATTINSTYVVQFWMSGNPGDCVQYPNGVCSPDNKTMTVHAASGPTTPFSFNTELKDNSFSLMKWEEQGYSFKATSATTTLTFASTTAGAFGPALDKVIVTEVVATGAQCKDDGWQDMRDDSGTLFRNQGACVSFYAKSGATPIGPAS
jgi:choice-of-anchor C domain-containing protein